MMADADERMEQITELLRKAEGFMTDAEFREEMETKQIRYLQAISHALLSLALQNQVIIDLLRSQSEYGDLPEH